MHRRLKRNLLDLVIIIGVIAGSFAINVQIPSGSTMESRGTLSDSVKADSQIKEETPIFKVDTEEKVAAITFDVNWAEKENLMEILNILKENDVKATFFVMGGWVNYSDENIEKLKAINEGGHDIGNHSYIHPSFTKITAEKMKEEADKTDAIIEKYTGKKPELFRFPSGEFNKEAFKVMRNLGYYCIQWNVDSVDWKETSAEDEYNRVMKKIQPGSILLFHNNAKYTPENLEKIIKDLKNQGYTFKPVSDLIYKDNYTVDSEGNQYKNN